jgi:site-specific DNA-methyltransferase (adenine-specific)
VWLPNCTRKLKTGHSDSIRSIGFAEDHRFNVRWLKEACRILKPDGTIWVTGTHHIIFSLGFALQSMRLKIINVIRS